MWFGKEINSQPAKLFSRLAEEIYETYLLECLLVN